MSDDARSRQAEHERRQQAEPGHDDSSCVCCCITCDPDEDVKEGAE